MTNSHFTELKKELQKGVTDAEHPFRYCTMATVGLDRMARLRTVRVRSVSDDMAISIYTDKRSKKIIHIKENKLVSMLFYHPDKLLQLKVEGMAVINKDQKLLKKLWKDIDTPSKKDYTTAMAPGSVVERPEQVEYLKEEDYFCLLEVHPFKIEYLKLRRPGHLRIRFSRQEDDWRSEFLVP